jgi:hypothetical protein
MPFTNIWDDNFPPDTQLANQLGLDLRNFRTDVQQRMASISGLDAAKPNFAGDAQPTNWNGVLFFATDTGHIYQFNNPVWIDVTVSFILRNAAIKNLTQITQTGDTAIHTIYTIPIPGGYLGTTGQLRITVPMLLNSTSGGPLVEANYGGTRISPAATIARSPSNVSMVLVGGNLGVTNSQSWDLLEFSYLSLNASGGNNFSHSTSAIDSTVNQNLTITFQGGVNADSITFFRCLVELL